ncbi:MAG: DNA recombination protein RmuC [Candidatus Omnitrophica bacterium]|nr:DNA recombination protein RmuC [Candidatus Omnitrophota bacterium]
MSAIILMTIGIILVVLIICVLVFFIRKMEHLQTEANIQLELRKQAIDNTVAGLKEELGRYQQVLRESEADRSRRFGSIENELKNASVATQKLAETTVRLNNILGNVKLRGQWGERMAEDIIRYAGLIENVNYLKQNVNASMTKPDFTFLLPQDHCINMDVKFPLDNYLQMINAQDGAAQETYEKEFIRNVKDRIKEIQNREYINPSDNTLDFVILFIPNEQVFSFIQEKGPEMMDEALKDKVVLCSPFTLYAVLSVIRQAHEHFRFEKDLKKIIELIGGFIKDYELFKNRFADLGTMLDKLSAQYAEITDKSFKKLDSKIQRIEDHKKGHLAIESPAAEVSDEA